MSHWFDELARRSVEGRLSRREALAAGALVAAATAVAPSRAFGQATRAECERRCGELGRMCCRINPAGSFSCCTPEQTCCAPPDFDESGVALCCEPGTTCCVGPGGARSCCRAGWVCNPSSPDLCEKCPLGEPPCGDVCCGEHEFCFTYPATGPACHPKCEVNTPEGAAPCYVYDPATGRCRDKCPPGTICDVRGLAGGGCVPQCTGSCRAYDAATGRCRDTCPPGYFCDFRGLVGDSEAGMAAATCQPKCQLDCAPYDRANDRCRDRCPRGQRCRASVTGGTCKCRANEEPCGGVCCPPGWFCDPKHGCVEHLRPVVNAAASVTMKGGSVTVKVRCPGPATCSGRLTLALAAPAGRAHAAARQVVLGARGFRVAPRRTAKVRVRIRRKRRRRITRRGVRVVASVRNRAGLIESGDAFRLRRR